VSLFFGSSIRRFFDLFCSNDPELGPLTTGEFRSALGDRDLSGLEFSVAVKIFDSRLLRFLLWMEERLGGLRGEDLHREQEEIRAKLLKAFQADLQDLLYSGRGSRPGARMADTET